MIRHLMLLVLGFVLMSATVRASEVVVLTEEPVAEFTLPDGSVLKNAFVWRRSSEGLMIVHDTGQYFLNFKLLPDDWKAAYLGEPEPKPAEDESAKSMYEVDDAHQLQPILETVPELSPEGINFVLRKDADENSVEAAFSMAILQSILNGNANDARRLIVLSEELGMEIEGVDREDLTKECSVCNGKGGVHLSCKTCSGSGKCERCDGNGKRETGMSNSTMHCTTCRGSGDCPTCQGEGGKGAVCRTCKGRGRAAERHYCEVRRDLIVHTVNQTANPDMLASAVKFDRDRIIKTLLKVPGLQKDAVRYYVSDQYDGSKDTEILVACVINSILRDDMENAERFHMSVKVNYGENEVMELKKYLDVCESCNGKGSKSVDCRMCRGSGNCGKCGGDGELESGFADKPLSCTKCRGNGNCTICNGNGEKRVQCTKCRGAGRKIDRERAEIKQDLLVKELNSYYQNQL